MIHAYDPCIRPCKKSLLPVLLLAFSWNGNLLAQDAQGEDLAKQLSNPVASLISVPIQFNYDDKFGPDQAGSVYRINIQPVIPVSIDSEWNLISRTIVPVIQLTPLFPN